MLYRLRTTRFITCSYMSQAEAAYLNAQYKLFGINARWVRESGSSRKRLALSAPWVRLESLGAHAFNRHNIQQSARKRTARPRTADSPV